tara:strand:- start:508 stop:678 length:171 start_codon:yes stop_codon:yes gene_type:complete
MGDEANLLSGILSELRTSNEIQREMLRTLEKIETLNRDNKEQLQEININTTYRGKF